MVGLILLALDQCQPLLASKLHADYLTRQLTNSLNEKIAVSLEVMIHIAIDTAAKQYTSNMLKTTNDTFDVIVSNRCVANGTTTNLYETKYVSSLKHSEEVGHTSNITKISHAPT